MMRESVDPNTGAHSTKMVVIRKSKDLDVPKMFSRTSLLEPRPCNDRQNESHYEVACELGV